MLSGNKSFSIASTITVLTSWLALVACNGITGANAIMITDDELEDEQTTASVGQGGATSSSGAGAEMPTTSSDTAAVSVGSGSGSTTSTSSGGPEPCTWPTGPYGVAQGQTLPSNLSWQGFAPGSTTASTISIQEFFDCDGMKGIDAVLFDTSQYG